MQYDAFSITGYLKQKFMVNIGPGKTSHAGLHRQMLGDYGLVGNDEMLRKNADSTSMAMMSDGRHCCFDDVDTTKPRSEATIKRMTGTKKYHARKMYSTKTKQNDEATINAMMNNPPISHVKDPAVKSRIWLFNWSSKFSHSGFSVFSFSSSSMEICYK